MDEELLDRLGRIKFDKDLTYTQIAQAIGVSEDTATNYFTGRTKLPKVADLRPNACRVTR